MFVFLRKSIRSHAKLVNYVWNKFFIGIRLLLLFIQDHSHLRVLIVKNTPLPLCLPLNPICSNLSTMQHFSQLDLLVL